MGAGSTAASTRPRHIILAEARARLSISTNKMAEDIGYDEAFVHRIENDGRALEAYPYDVLKDVAEYLKLIRRTSCAPHPNRPTSALEL